MGRSLIHSLQLWHLVFFKFLTTKILHHAKRVLLLNVFNIRRPFRHSLYRLKCQIKAGYRNSRVKEIDPICYLNTLMIKVIHFKYLKIKISMPVASLNNASTLIYQNTLKMALFNSKDGIGTILLIFRICIKYLLVKEPF